VIAQLFYPKSKTQLRIWFLFHLGIGFLALISNLFIIIWFYIILIQGIRFVKSAKTVDSRHLSIINLLLYVVPFEIIGRMVKCSPYIPYELGKYLTFMLLLWGLSYSRNSKKIGYVLIAILIPGIILGWQKSANYQGIIFNAMGLVNLGLGIAYFGGLFLYKSKFELDNGLRLVTYSLFTALIYTFLKTPDYAEVDFNLGANFETSGGFGSNQVSTAFGLGLFLCFYLWQKSYSFTGFGQNLDLAVAGFFLFQGLLTFSRGGVVGGAFAILLYLVLSYASPQSGKQNRLKKLNLYFLVYQYCFY